MKCECGNGRFKVDYKELIVGTAYVSEEGDLDDAVESDGTGIVFTSPYKCTQCEKEYDELD